MNDPDFFRGQWPLWIDSAIPTFQEADTQSSSLDFLDRKSCMAASAEDRTFRLVGLTGRKGSIAPIHLSRKRPLALVAGMSGSSVPELAIGDRPPPTAISVASKYP